MTFMGLDLGSKTLGLSISTSGIIASTYKTLYFKENDYELAAAMMIDVLKLEHVDCLVIGYPKHMNNDVGLRAHLSEEIKVAIQNVLPIEIVLWDERLSTKQALQALSLQKVKGRDQRKKKDELAAVVILQNYLNYKGERQ